MRLTASEDIKSSKGGVDYDHDWAAGYENQTFVLGGERSGSVPISGLMIINTEHNPLKINVRTNLPITDQYVMYFFHRVLCFNLSPWNAIIHRQ